VFIWISNSPRGIHRRIRRRMSHLVPHVPSQNRRSTNWYAASGCQRHQKYPTATGSGLSRYVYLAWGGMGYAGIVWTGRVDYSGVSVGLWTLFNQLAPWQIHRTIFSVDPRVLFLSYKAESIGMQSFIIYFSHFKLLSLLRDNYSIVPCLAVCVQNSSNHTLFDFSFRENGTLVWNHLLADSE